MLLYSVKWTLVTNFCQTKIQLYNLIKAQTVLIAKLLGFKFNKEISRLTKDCNIEASNSGTRRILQLQLVPAGITSYCLAGHQHNLILLQLWTGRNTGVNYV